MVETSEGVEKWKMKFWILQGQIINESKGEIGSGVLDVFQITDRYESIEGLYNMLSKYDFAFHLIGWRRVHSHMN